MQGLLQTNQNSKFDKANINKTDLQRAEIAFDSARFALSPTLRQHTVLDRKSNGEKNRWPSELRLGFTAIGVYNNISLTPTSLSLKANAYWSETMIKHPPSF